MKNARSDNPYKDAIETYFGDDEPMLLNPTKPVYVPSQTDTYHLVTDYDTLDTLGFDKYGNSKLFHIIGHANNFIEPFTLIPGTTLRIPNLAEYQLKY
jgi:nucleoid-associated protein YgaU